MEKKVLSGEIKNFCDAQTALEFYCDGEKTVLPYSDIERLSLNGNVHALKMKLIVETKEYVFTIDYTHKQFFDLLYDMLGMRLDVDMEAVFSAANSNNTQTTVIYEIKEG